MTVMEERAVNHSTFVIERSYPTSPERVFAAFADPAKKRRWFLDEKDTEVDTFQMDFRVGGFERSSFRVQSEGPVKGMVISNMTTYLDIVANNRIVLAYIMAVAGSTFSASLATFELLPTAHGTNLVYTEQAAFFAGGDGPERRKQGWTKLLDSLAKELAR